LVATYFTVSVCVEAFLITPLEAKLVEVLVPTAAVGAVEIDNFSVGVTKSVPQEATNRALESANNILFIYYKI
jgi:hypothetical protein